MTSRDAAGRFKPGHSGNAGGRHKDTENVRELARQYTAEAIAALVDVMRTGKEGARAAAATALLDRGWGKPLSTVEFNKDDRGDRLGIALVRDAAAEFLRDPVQRAAIRNAVRGSGTAPSPTDGINKEKT